MVDLILDAAGQKGTGKWTVISALDLGVPLTLIAEAVFARCLSAQKDERVAASQGAQRAHARRSRAIDRERSSTTSSMALYASKIISYAQGYRADGRHGQGVELGAQQRRRRPDVARRLHHPQRLPRQDQGGVRPRPQARRTCCSTPTSRGEIDRRQDGWRRVCAAAAIAHGIPLPAMTSALAYFDGYRSERLPANLLQAQRDYFGAHTYERVDRPRGQFFHTNWTGRGGTTASTTYNV